MADGNDVLNYMPIDASPRDATTDLKAVNFALVSSWPHFKMEEFAEVGTLSSNTYEYAMGTGILDPQPSLELGVAMAYIAETTLEPKVIHRGVQQRYSTSDGYWTLIVSDRLASKHSGRSLYVRYQYAHPVLTSLDDTVYMPLAIAGQIAALFYQHMLATRSTYDSAFNRAIAPEFYRVDTLAQRARTPQLPVLVPHIGKERLG